MQYRGDDAGRQDSNATRWPHASTYAQLIRAFWVAAGIAVVLLSGPTALAGGSRDCSLLRAKYGQSSELRARIAGVPAILHIPNVIRKPPIILWHGFGPPASKEALADALPLDDVPAVKVYLDLPLFGERLPSGGVNELARRQTEDFASLIFAPSVVGAASELSAVVSELQRVGCMFASDKVGVFGFSAGGTAAFIALIQRRIPIGAAVTVNASTGLQASVEAYERAAKRNYPWTPVAREVAEDTDAIAHARQMARGTPPPALLLIHGKDDLTLNPGQTVALYNALLPYYGKAGDTNRLDLIVATKMNHAWTTAPIASQLRVSIAEWFNRYL
jgi:pimeloyl-ACP methyl ester carboxylesterase